jgi:hypothetical protein
MGHFIGVSKLNRRVHAAGSGPAVVMGHHLARVAGYVQAEASIVLCQVIVILNTLKVTMKEHSCQGALHPVSNWQLGT